MPTQTIEVWDNRQRNAGEYRSTQSATPPNLVAIAVRCGLEEVDRLDTGLQIGFGLEGLYDGAWQILATTQWTGGTNRHGTMPNPRIDYQTTGTWPTELRGWLTLNQRTRLDLFVDLVT